MLGNFCVPTRVSEALRWHVLTMIQAILTVSMLQTYRRCSACRHLGSACICLLHSNAATPWPTAWPRTRCACICGRCFVRLHCADMWQHRCSPCYASAGKALSIIQMIMLPVLITQHRSDSESFRALCRRLRLRQHDAMPWRSVDHTIPGCISRTVLMVCSCSATRSRAARDTFDQYRINAACPASIFKRVPLQALVTSLLCARRSMTMRPVRASARLRCCARWSTHRSFVSRVDVALRLEHTKGPG